MKQLALPVSVSLEEVKRKASLGKAIELCAEAAGLEPKQVQDKLSKTDKSQWSRWVSGSEGITWDKFASLMDLCGNDAPLLWMLHARGYELASLRKRETETEQALRQAHERIEQLERERAVERRLLSDVMAGRVSGT